MEDCFKLLHFHLGSQITNIRFIKGALIEAAQDVGVARGHQEDPGQLAQHLLAV